MLVQGLSGLAMPWLYRDEEPWILAAWRGNDAVTAFLAAPLLSLATVRAARGSTRGLLLALGVLWYCFYNGAYYLVGAALGVFFPLYVISQVSCASTLIVSVRGLDPEAIAAAFGPRTPTRGVGVSLVLVGALLVLVWTVQWARYVTTGALAAPSADAVRLIAAMDTTVIAPTLIAGGVLLLRRRPWGFVVGALGAALGALYATVLAAGTLVGLSQQLPGMAEQLPLWCVLALVLYASLTALLRDVEGPVTSPDTESLRTRRTGE
jgi:hypothetical protein